MLCLKKSLLSLHTMHLAHRPLTSSIDYGFKVVATHQCGAYVKKNSKLKTQSLTIQFPRIKGLGENEITI